MTRTKLLFTYALFCCFVFVVVSLFLSIPNAPASQLYSTFKYGKSQNLTSNSPDSNNAFSLEEQLQSAYPYHRFDKSKIPSFIWQTWKQEVGNLDTDLRSPEASWSNQHPSHVHMVVNNKKSDELIKSLYASVPQIYQAYHNMLTDIHRADFFRYLILFAIGGTYSDIDTYNLKPIWEWYPEGNREELEMNVGLVVGIEADPVRIDWAKWYSRRVQMCQWTIRAKSGHPILASIIVKIVNKTFQLGNDPRLTSDVEHSTMEYTGPGVWTDSIMEYLNDPKHFTREDQIKADPIRLGRKVTSRDLTQLETHKLLGDVMLLPITSFSPGINHMGSKGVDDPMAFVSHRFLGSWKEETKEKEKEEREKKKKRKQANSILAGIETI